MAVDYSLVLGLDHSHNEQAKLVLPTWFKHKPDFLKRPLIVFYDRTQLQPRDLWWMHRQHENVTLQAWPFVGTTYTGSNNSKWDNSQRNLMLSGFIHVPAMLVDTEYWLKLDTDVVAFGMSDWIDPEWFKDTPAIAAPKWHYTKPPDQMLKLDEWAEKHDVFDTPSLNLVPDEGAKSVKHSRICSWCAFFRTDFTQVAARLAMFQHQYTIPVASQDGYHWYVAERMAEPIIRIFDMKERGWSFYSRTSSIAQAVKESMNDQQAV